jgi:AraC family transcriptional regulator
MSDSRILLKRDDSDSIRAFDDAVPVCQILSSSKPSAGIENFEHLRAVRDEPTAVSYTLPALVVLRYGAGKAGVYSNGHLQTHQFRAESVVVFPVGFRHICNPSKGSDFYCMTFDQAELRASGEEIGIAESQLDLVPIMGKQDPLLAQLVSSLHRVMSSDLIEGGRLLRESVAKSVMIRLWQVSRWRESASCALPAIGGLQTRIKKVVDFLRDDPGCDIGLAGLARIASLSPSHFARSFKRFTGISPAEFQRRERVAMMERMLLSKDIPLQEIAATVGFDSVQGMRKAFQRVNGIAMRRTHGGVLLPGCEER